MAILNFKQVAKGLMTLGLFLPLATSATVLTFDDLTPTNGAASIPDGYGGLNWTQMGYLNSSAAGGGYVGGTVSGEYVAFNDFAAIGTVDNGVFDFNSAYLAAGWNEGLQVAVRGFLGGSQLYSETVGVTYSQTLGASAQQFDFNFLGVDRLEFESFGGVDADGADGGVGAHFAMDDFTLNEPTSVPESVPEPGALGLLGAGLFAFALLRRRRSL